MRDGVETSRRGFLVGATGLAVSSLVGGGTRRAQAADPPAAGRLDPDAALARLMEGNARYVKGELTPLDLASTRAALAQGQAPHSIVLGCADSRVPPEITFDQGRGDIFVVRLAGNFVNRDGLASIEYAVKFLGASLIMVLGHSKCGAVDAAIKLVEEKAELPGHLPDMVNELRPAVEASAKEKGDRLANAVRANVVINANELRGAKPIVAEAVATGRVKVVGAVYDLATGKVELVS